MKWNKINIDNFCISLNEPLYLEIDSYTKLDILVKEGISTKLVIIANNDYDINVLDKAKGFFIISLS